MALGFPFNFRVASNQPLDSKYGPYLNMMAALASVLPGERYVGLSVNVAGEEYWWKDGITDEDLILKYDQSITLTGDVTGSGSDTLSVTIANGAVTVSKMADITTSSFLGRSTAGTGVPEVLSVATVKTVLGAGAANGLATLDSNGYIPNSQLPPLAVNEVFTVVNESAMLALTAQRGDMAIRSDNGKTYVLSADTPAVLSAWKEVMAAGQVVSVNGYTGIVSLTKADLGLGSVENVALSTWAGSTAITTVGTIGTGTWNATTIGVAKGGTNITSYAVGDLLYASASATLSKLADVATGNVLLSGGVGAAPSYGKVGLTTHVSGILPVANGGTGLSALGAANTLVRVNAGATALEYFTPSYITANQTITLGTDLSGSGTTTLNATIVSGAVTLTKMANFAANSIMGNNTGSPATPMALNATQVRTLLNVADGANNYSHPTGDGNLHVPATSTTNNGRFLKAGATAGSLSWANIASSDVSGLGSLATASSITVSQISDGTTVGDNLLLLANPSAIRFIRINADNTVSALDAATFRTAIGAGTSSTVGTVTSVAMTVPTGLSIGGTPITTSGTLALTYTSGYQGYTTTEATKLSGIAANANNYSLPVASSTVYGGVELGSDTVQTAAAASLGSTAGRTYLSQLNGSGQLVVNVPWTDTTTNATITLSGAVTGSGTDAITTALASGVVGFSNMVNSAAAGLSVVGRSANSAGVFAEISAGTDGHILRRSGTALGFGLLTDANITTSTIGLDKLVNSAAAGLSVLGRSANSAGVFAEIAAGTDGHILRRSGTVLGFGLLTNANITTSTIALDKLINSAAAGISVLGRSANSAGVFAEIAAGTDGHVLRRSGTTLGFGTIAAAALPTSGVSAGSYTNANITVDTYGRITAASNGAGGGGSPGGSTTQIQYNNSGAFAGSEGFTFDSSSSSIVLARTTATATQCSTVTFERDNSSTAITAGTYLGAIVFNGHDGVGYRGGPVISAVAESTYSGTNAESRIMFNTIPNGSIGTGITRLVIGPNGQLGFNPTDSSSPFIAPNYGTSGQVLISGGAGGTANWGSVPVTAIASIAANTFLANTTAGSAVPTAVATNRMPLFASAITGTASSSTFLRGDGSWQSVSASPGGSSTQVQYNSSGAFAGSSSFTFNSGTGVVTATNFATSDERLKSNIIKGIDYTNEVYSISKLVSNYDRYLTVEKTGVHFSETGFIAQELLKVASRYVNTGDELLGVNYANMVAPLYQVVGKLIDRINELEAKLKA